jgi:hypothetical protein
MELPAHLPERLLQSQFPALLIQILQLHSIIILVLILAEGLQLLLQCLVLVPSE